MRDRPIGGAIFAAGIIFIASLAAYHYVIKPLICGVTAGCGVASW